MADKEWADVQEAEAVKIPPGPCVSTASLAKTLPLALCSTAFAAKYTAFALRMSSGDGEGSGRRGRGSDRSDRHCLSWVVHCICAKD